MFVMILVNFVSRNFHACEICQSYGIHAYKLMIANNCVQCMHAYGYYTDVIGGVSPT